MNRRAGTTSRATAFALATLLLAWPGAAAAQCTYTILSSSYPVTATAPLQYYNFTQYSPYWAAIGVRPNTIGTDWDISVWQTSASYPDCVSGLLMNSVDYGSRMDFVIGDFNHNPQETYRIAALRWSGSSPGTVEWHGGSDQLVVNSARVQKALGPSDMIQVYDVNLVAGTTYRFQFATMGPADIRYFVFENVGGGPYWGNRAGAALQANDCASYTPTVSGWHGVAVVCDSGEGTYEIGISQGDCDCPAALADGVPIDVWSGTRLYSMSPTSGTWSAAAIRYDGTLQACQLAAYSEPYGAPAPDCLTGELAVDGNRSPVQILAADYNLNPLRTSFLQAYCEQDVTLEWAQSSGMMFVNDLPTEGTFGATGVVDVYEIGLQAGHTYTCEIFTISHEVELRVYGPTSGTLFSSGALVQTMGTASFTATTSGYYGVVAINRSVGARTYDIMIRECRPITALTSGVPRVTYGDEDLFSFDQAHVYWAAIGARDPVWDVDLFTFSAPGTGPYPNCLTGPLASSLDVPPQVDYVIADFNHTTPTRYYAKTWNISVSGDTWIEWDDGTDQVAPNGGPVHRSWTAGDVLDVYDVFLEGGKTYGFNLVASGLSARLDGFRSSSASFWGNYSDRMWTMGPGESYTYACPISDWYGLVVVHQDMNPGAYDLSVVSRGVAVEDDLSLVTGVTALEPNPARGLLRVQYALRERGSVGFRVLDVGGREVWRREPEMCDAGRWSLVWDRSGTDAPRLAPGIYFLHMTVDDRPVALRKVTLLR